MNKILIALIIIGGISAFLGFAVISGFARNESVPETEASVISAEEAGQIFLRNVPEETRVQIERYQNTDPLEVLQMRINQLFSEYQEGPKASPIEAVD